MTLDISEIRAAGERIAPYIKHTPLERSESLSKRFGTNVYVKYELFQKTGAFKVRGGFNKLLQMSSAERAKGVVAVSGGNHAQAVAHASSVLGVDAVILMPENTPLSYLEATRGYGATVDLQPTIAEAFAKVAEYENEGRVFVHPFDDEDVIAGQGTVGLEILEDLPETTDVILSIGGGGLAAGIAIAIKAIDPSIRIWGVETIGADAMSRALEAGKPVTMPAITSIAKTLGAPFVSDLTLHVVKDHFEGVTVVPDSDAVSEMLYIAERLKVITEPAAAVTVAAAEVLRENFDANCHLVLIFCGGNTSVQDICRYISAGV